MDGLRAPLPHTQPEQSIAPPLAQYPLQLKAPGAPAGADYYVVFSWRICGTEDALVEPGCAPRRPNPPGSRSFSFGYKDTIIYQSVRYNSREMQAKRKDA